MEIKILVIGPSPLRSKGGMASVIDEIQKDENLNKNARIDIYESYTDGNRIHVLLYSVYAYIRFLCTKRNYDIYHIHAASYGSTFRKGLYVDAVKHWGKKVIFHIHGSEYVKFYDSLTERKKKMVKEILHKPDTVVALSQDWKDKFDKMFGLTNCVVLENGINMDALKLAICDPGEHIKEFAVLGRLGKRKGTYDLIETMEIVVKTEPEIICYLAGDGEIDKVNEAVHEKNLENNIKVLGWVSGQEKIELLSKVATVILPSYNEGLPMSILEGMACGKAIISTKVGAIPEVIKEENGILLEPGDVRGLAEAILDICSSPEKAGAYGANNIALVRENFSMDVMHEKLKKIYEEEY